MATFQEHMADDFTVILNEQGSVRQVDGEDLLCLLHPVELLPGEYQAALVERCRLSYLAGAVDDRVVGQQVKVDSEYWTIVSISTAGASVAWTLERGAA